MHATIKGVSSLVLISPVYGSFTSFDLSKSLAFLPESASLTYMEDLNDVHAAADISWCSLTNLPMTLSDSSEAYFVSSLQ